MKKIIFGVFAVALALLGSAFTKPHVAFTNYWFPENSSGTPLTITTTATAPPTSDVYGCNTTDITPCAGTYTTYNTTNLGGTPTKFRYTATSTRGTEHFKN